MTTLSTDPLKIAIIEDEKPAAEKLARSILTIRPDCNIEAILHNCSDAIDWLSQNKPDLIFMDIELTDGLSFEIFDNTNIHCPVIFVTAYDHYWQKAFAYNGIDYLLKPFQDESLAASINKYDQIKDHFTSNLQRLLGWIKEHETEPALQTKSRFLLKRGLEYVKVETRNIAYFYATQKLVCLVSFDQGKFILDKSLTELMVALDKQLFYRVNRKFVVNQNAIKTMRILSKSKLRLELTPPIDEEIIISQDQVSNFKKWLSE